MMTHDRRTRPQTADRARRRRGGAGARADAGRRGAARARRRGQLRRRQLRAAARGGAGRGRRAGRARRRRRRRARRWPTCCASLAHGCGSTALAFSMHTHQVAIPAWRWTHQKVAAVEPLLKRVATERILLLSSGGSDWIGGSGTAEKVEGGYRDHRAQGLHLRRAEAGDILMTGAVLEEDGVRSVLHFGAPMKAAEVRDRGHLAHARHARHRLERRGDRRAVRARRRRWR